MKTKELSAVHTVSLPHEHGVIDYNETLQNLRHLQTYCRLTRLVIISKTVKSATSCYSELYFMPWMTRQSFLILHLRNVVAFYSCLPSHFKNANSHLMLLSSKNANHSGACNGLPRINLFFAMSSSSKMQAKESKHVCMNQPLHVRTSLMIPI